MFRSLKSDFAIIKERDPAARGVWEIIFCYPGFQAIVMHRISHKLWRYKLPLIPRFLSHLTRFFTGVEIHPGAKIGKAVFIDHGMGVVIGETSEIGDRCLLYQGVTLGGTGKESGKRHPTLEANVVVGAGAKVLGGICVGTNTRIGAGSVVVKNVGANSTVVGIPGRIVHQSGVKINPLAHSALPDTEANVLLNLMERIDQLESDILCMKDLVDKLKNKNKTKKQDDLIIGESQNLRDKEIIEFIGELENDKTIKNNSLNPER
tara:strand:+ start:211 stop:999 length:789 start_codon:yes stop_codon:yes gene_type:complete